MTVLSAFHGTCSAHMPGIGAGGLTVLCDDVAQDASSAEATAADDGGARRDGARRARLRYDHAAADAPVTVELIRVQDARTAADPARQRVLRADV